MPYSLNEIEALCKRAARGSGLSWGLSEEAARASRWLASFGLPGPQMLAALLELNDSLPLSDLAPVSLAEHWHAPLGRMSPIIAGAALSDCATRIRAGESIVMHNVTQPLLVLPFAAMAAGSLNTSIQIAWDDILFSTTGTTLNLQGDRASATATQAGHLTCSLAGDIANSMPSCSRAEIDQESMASLSRFAGRTYAPATEASRVSGAGAGLDGND